MQKFTKENLLNPTITTFERPPGTADKSEGYVLYCMRHTVETLLNNHPDNIENDKIDTLLGHAIKSIGRKHYGGYDVSTLKRVVEKIDYPNAQLPWDVDPHYSDKSFTWEAR